MAPGGILRGQHRTLATARSLAPRGIRVVRLRRLAGAEEEAAGEADSGKPGRERRFPPEPRLRSFSRDGFDIVEARSRG